MGLVATTAILYGKRPVDPCYRHFFLALIEADLCGDLEYQSYICFNLAMIYVDLGRWEGLSYYKQALAYFRKRGDTTNYKITLKKLRLARVRLRAIGVAV